MEIYKHKISGKYFIFIEHTGIKSANFVNPVPKILELEFYNFEENPLDKSTEYFVQHQLVTNEQIKRYQQHLKYRFQDEAAREKARFDSIYEGWSIEEIENEINRLKKGLKKEKARDRKSESKDMRVGIEVRRTLGSIVL